MAPLLNLPAAAATPDPVAVLDPAAAGAKAATLARARMAGLPVAPGYVLPVAAGAAAARAGAEALSRGERGRARRAALGVPAGAAQGAALRTAVERLGGRVIVRSSSPLEGDPRWSGAFASLGEVGPGDVEAAVRSCRASAFAADPIGRAERCGVPPEALALGILVQPELTFTAGGTARLTADGTVEIHGVPGHPAALLSGWADALTPATGLTELAGPDAVRRIACLTRATHTAIGTNHLEWGLSNGAVVLLQASYVTDTSRTTPDQACHAEGRRVSGTRCVPGGAYGTLRYVRPHAPAPPGTGHILVADRPRPALAPLLFGAAGLVCTGGPAASHLGEVARSLGVPMLVGVPVHEVTGPLTGIAEAGGWYGAIDATTAELTLRQGETGG